MNISVTKASGEKSRFSEKKLVNSLLRAGANADQINFIVREVNRNLFEGISTKAIYKMAFGLLRENAPHLAARYHLKNAIMELGPSGYPFEKYIGEILRVQGYETRVSVIVDGECVTHEIDVIAEKEDHCYMIECKYHNQRGIICDVKIPLYIHARFNDVKAKLVKVDGHVTKFYQGWLVTNTKFSSDALKYGNCAGLKLIGWDYPEKGSLKDQIDALGLYPITCLTSLTKHEKQNLLDQKIVLCKEIYGDEKVLKFAGVKAARISVVMKEAEQLCRNLK